MSKKSVILIAVTVLCIVATVYLRGAVDRVEAEYTEVEVTVISSETKYKKILRERRMYYEVIVLYEGQQYELENVHNSYSYIPGRSAEAYLSDGRLYANIEGVKTSTPTAMVYFAFLFASFGMLIVSLSSLGIGQKK